MWGTVRRSLTIPAILAFLFCFAAPFIIPYVGEYLLPWSGCSVIIPKLNEFQRFQGTREYCLANRNLWNSLLLLLLPFVLSFVFSIVYNLQHIKIIDLSRVSAIQVISFFTLICGPAIVAVLTYFFEELSLRRYGSPARIYTSVSEYADSQVSLLLFSGGILLFVPTVIILSLVIERIGEKLDG